MADVAADQRLDADMTVWWLFAIPSASLNDFGPRRISEEAFFHWMHGALQALQETDVNNKCKLASSALLVVNTLNAALSNTRRVVNSITCESP